MSDCAATAWNAPRGIDGEIRWDDGMRSGLHYARYVNGRERRAIEVVLDGERFVRAPKPDWDSGEVCD